MDLAQINFFWCIFLIKFETSILASSFDQCYLPKGCQLIKPYEIHNRYPYTIKCGLDDAGFNISTNITEIMLEKCEINKNDDNDFLIFFYVENPFTNSIFEKRYHFKHLINDYILKFTNKTVYKITFNYIQGFEINFNKYDTHEVNSANFKVQFFKSNFEFFIVENSNNNNKRRRVESCEDVAIDSIDSSVFDVFQVTPDLSIKFNQCVFKSKVCPFVFNNSDLYTLEIDGMINYFLKTNLLEFFELKNTSSSSNSTKWRLLRTKIMRLFLSNVENAEINNKILDVHVFKSLWHLTVSGTYFSIHTDLFKPFTNLKSIVIQISENNLLKITGIEWMRFLNANVNVSLDEVDLMLAKVSDCVKWKKKLILKLESMRSIETKLVEFTYIEILNRIWCAYYIYTLTLIQPHD